MGVRNGAVDRSRECFLLWRRLRYLVTHGKPPFVFISAFCGAGSCEVGSPACKGCGEATLRRQPLRPQSTGSAGGDSLSSHAILLHAPTADGAADEDAEQVLRTNDGEDETGLGGVATWGEEEARWRRCDPVRESRGIARFSSLSAQKQKWMGWDLGGFSRLTGPAKICQLLDFVSPPPPPRQSTSLLQDCTMAAASNHHATKLRGTVPRTVLPD